MKNNSAYLENPSLEVVAGNRSYYEFCDSLESLMKKLAIRRIREQNIAGAQYENAAKSFKSTVLYKAGRSDANAKLVAKQLAEVNKLYQSSESSASKTPPPAPASPTAPPVG